jgi:hypothetical protein
MRWKRRRSLPVTSGTLLAFIVPIELERRAVLLRRLPDDHRTVRPQAVGDVGRVSGIILPAVQDYPDLAVAREGLDQVIIEIGLAPRHDYQPSFGS